MISLLDKFRINEKKENVSHAMKKRAQQENMSHAVKKRAQQEMVGKSHALNKGEQQENMSHAVKKRGQQEMVGFVLIVVVVVIGLMIFLVWSAFKDTTDMDDKQVYNMLNSILESTSGCNSESNLRPDSMADVFKGCFENRRCNNINKDSCEYLNETLIDIMDSLLLSETAIISYQIEMLERDDRGSRGVYRLSEGNCSSGGVTGAQSTLSSYDASLLIRLKICRA